MSSRHYAIGTSLDDDEIVAVRVLAAKGGYRSLGAYVTAVLREEIEAAEQADQAGEKAS